WLPLRKQRKCSRRMEKQMDRAKYCLIRHSSLPSDRHARTAPRHRSICPSSGTDTAVSALNGVEVESKTWTAHEARGGGVREGRFRYCRFWRTTFYIFFAPGIFFLRATEIFGSFATRMFHFCARLQFREACAPRPTRLHRRLQGRTNWSWTGYSVGRF